MGWTTTGSRKARKKGRKEEGKKVKRDQKREASRDNTKLSKWKTKVETREVESLNQCFVLSAS